MRAIAYQSHVRIKLALKQLSDKDRRLGRNDVANQHASEARGELGNIVACLVGVSENHQRGIHFADQFFGRCRIRVRRIRLIDRIGDEGRSEFLCRGQNLSGHALFDNGQDAHITRASKRSLSTSLAAAALASPSKIWPCLLFSGA